MIQQDYWRDGRDYMVSADHAWASQAGAEILARGGNAVDAAVAVSFALAVVRPQSAGLGGGGFMLIHRPGDAPVALDFRETAPMASRRSDYLDSDGKPIAGKTVHGPWAVGVPSQATGLWHAWERFGSKKITWAEAIMPARKLAMRPLVVDKHMHRASAELQADAERHPEYPGEYSELYRRFTQRGRTLPTGAVVDRRDMLPVLDAVAADGPSALVDGPLADAIFAELERRGGLLTRADVRDYQVRELPPLRTYFDEHEVLSMPPPSSGGAVIAQVMNVLSILLREGMLAWHAPVERAHVLVEALKHAFADRANLLGDRCPGVLADVEHMVSAERAAHVGRHIRRDATWRPDAYGLRAARDDAGTSHYCVADSTGMAVSGTDTVNLTFGSYVCVPGTGLILNNEIDDFAIDPDTPNAFGLRESPRNLLRPGMRPLSSMSPTIVTRDNQTELVAGGSGGPRIITATLSVLLHSLIGKLPIEQAVTAPRLHHQWWPDEVWLQRDMPAEVVMALMDRGHTVRWYPGTAGHAQAIARIDGGWRGACDPDKQGCPCGGP